MEKTQTSSVRSPNQEDDLRYLTEPRWKAIFDDGSFASSHYNEWLDLKNTKKIVNIELGFRSNVIKPLPSHAEGYFFRRSAMCFMDNPEILNIYVIGYLKDGFVHCKHYVLPALLIIDETIRDINDVDLVGESLIVNE